MEKQDRERASAPIAQVRVRRSSKKKRRDMQAHYLHPAVGHLLDSHLSEVKEALLRVGCVTFDPLATVPRFITDRTPREGDERLITITGRRPAIEYAVASVAERLLPVRRGASVVGLLTGPSAAKGTPHVAGVRTVDGKEVSADLIVDAMGRHSKLPNWLEAIGARRPIEEAEISGFIYYTRFFRSTSESAENEGQVKYRMSEHFGTNFTFILVRENLLWSNNPSRELPPPRSICMTEGSLLALASRQESTWRYPLSSLTTGPTLTAKVARDLAVFLRRHGGHDQTSIYLSFRDHLHPGVHRVQDWLSTDFGEPVRLPRLAKLANMSSRNLVRAFKTATGLTPLQYQQRLRLEFAGSLLRDSQLTLESIAESSGFADARHFRRLRKSTFNAPPSELRKA